jgi:sugar lactone lactonase YvrE
LPATALILVAATLILVAGTPPAQARERFDIDLFARVPDPGSPEGIAIDSRGIVFVGTDPRDGGPLGARSRSKVFAYDGAGQLLREYLISGQDVDDPFYGLLGMAFDGEDLLYALDTVPPRVIRLNPRTGGQRTYARFRDVPTCEAAGRTHNCSDSDFDLAPVPDYPVFGPSGEMYVTDLSQALIWRVPAGGGRPKVWFTDAGLETLFGPNGIQFMADGRTLLFALTTQSNPTADPQRSAGLYKLPVRRDGRPGRLDQFWESGMADAPDGFAIARSGNVYVALAGTTGNAIAVVSPAGEEIARAPPTEAENQMMEVPFDQPGSAAFLGQRVLVTNHALFSRNPDHYAVLDVFADERGLPLFRPTVRDR